MATTVETKLERALKRIEELERKLNAHMAEHEQKRREWEEIEESILNEVGAESLEDFEAQQMAQDDQSRLAGIVASTSYEEWERRQEED